MGADLAFVVCLGLPILWIAGLIGAASFACKQSKESTRLVPRLIPLGLWLLPAILFIGMLVMPTSWEDAPPGYWPRRVIVYSGIQETILFGMFVLPLVAGLIIDRLVGVRFNVVHRYGPAVVGALVAIASVLVGAVAGEI
jgi:hypothetical protein